MALKDLYAALNPVAVYTMDGEGAHATQESNFVVGASGYNQDLVELDNEIYATPNPDLVQAATLNNVNRDGAPLYTGGPATLNFKQQTVYPRQPYGMMASLNFDHADHNDLNPTVNGMSIAFWAYLPDSSFNYKVLVGKGLGYDSAIAPNLRDLDWVVWYDPSTSTLAFHGASAPAPPFDWQLTFRAKCSVDLNTPVFIVCTLEHDGPNPAPHIYIDGVEVTYTQYQNSFGENLLKTTYGLVVGADITPTVMQDHIDTEGSYWIHGYTVKAGTRLGDLALFDYELSSAQILALYNGTIGNTTDFPFGGCSTLVSDESYTDYDTQLRYSVFGGPDDLWGATAEDMLTLVNDPEFTFVFSVDPTEATSGSISVHDVLAKVYYGVDNTGPQDPPPVIPAPPAGLTSVTMQGPRSVAVGLAGAFYYSEDNGLTWTKALNDDTNGDMPLVDYHAVTFSNGLYIAVGQNSIVATSTDGTRWSVEYPDNYPGRHVPDLNNPSVRPTFYDVKVIELEYSYFSGHQPKVGDFIQLSTRQGAYGPIYTYKIPYVYIVGDGTIIKRQLAYFAQELPTDPGYENFAARFSTEKIYWGVVPGAYNSGTRYLYGTSAANQFVWENEEVYFLASDGTVAIEYYDKGNTRFIDGQVPIDLFSGKATPGYHNVGVTRAAATSDSETVVVGEGGVVYRVAPSAQVLLDQSSPEAPAGSANKSFFDTGSSIVSFHGIAPSAPGYPYLYDIAYSNGVYLAVGEGGYIGHSQDGGMTWTALNSGTNKDLFGVDTEGGAFIAVGEDETVVMGLLEGGNEVSVEETMQFNDTLPGRGLVNGLVEDSFSGLDSTADDMSGIAHYGAVEDGLWSLGVPGANMNRNELSAEILALIERGILNDEVLLETISFVEGVADFLKGVWEESVSETFDFTESVLDFIGAQYFEEVAEILALSGAQKHATGLVVSDQIGIVANAYLKLRFAMARAEELAISAPQTGHLVLFSSLSDQVALNDSAGSNATINRVISEIVQCGAALVLNDDPTLYSGWAMNLKNLAVTQYTNFNFNSLVELDGLGLGAASDGLYELDGDDDEGTPIPAHFRTGDMDFGTGRETRVREAWIGQIRSGDMVLKTITDQAVERWYLMKQRKAGLREQRLGLHLGVEANYWAFELHNVNGADFEHDYIKLTPLILSRRGN